MSERVRGGLRSSYGLTILVSRFNTATPGARVGVTVAPTTVTRCIIGRRAVTPRRRSWSARWSAAGMVQATMKFSFSTLFTKIEDEGRESLSTTPHNKHT